MRPETFLQPPHTDSDPDDLLGEKKALIHIAAVRARIQDTRNPQERQESTRLIVRIKQFLQNSTTMPTDQTAAVLDLFGLERFAATKEDQRRAFARLANYFKANEDPAVARDPRIVGEGGYKPNGLAALRLVLERMELPTEDLVFYQNLLNEYIVKPDAFSDLKPKSGESFLFEGESVSEAN